MVNNNRRVIIVPLENKPRSSWVNDPYIGSLTKTYGDAQSFKGFSGISLPDYLMESSGSNQGRTTDSFSLCEFNVNNIFRVLTANNLKYENYAESGNQGNGRHIPGNLYPDTCKGVQNLATFISKYVNGTSIPTNYTWLTPNFCDCGHDCPVTTVSAWLQNTLKLDTILAKPWFTDGSTLIIIVCDDGGSASVNTLCLMISTTSMSKTSSKNYNHINDLSTAMWWLGIPGSIGNSAANIAMTDLFGSTPPPILTAITVSPTSAPVSIGGTIQLTATCKDQNDVTITCPALTWTSDHSTIASVNSSGLVTGIATGTANITAISGSITSNSSTITVNQQPVLTSITVSPATVSVGINGTTRLSAICKDQNNIVITCPILSWISSDISKATVDSTGRVTGIATGTANITTKSGTIVSNMSTVTVVSSPVLASITVSPVTVSIGINGIVQLAAICKDQNNATITCPGLTWVSSDQTKATVSSTGKVTGIAAGATNVTAKSGTITSNISTVTISTVPNAIVVTNPTAGLIYLVGEPRVVRWTHTATTGANVKIELLKASISVKTISSSTPNNDVFSWTIPSVITGNDYQIRVTDLTNAQNTGISGNFTIKGSTPPPILTSIVVSPGTASVNVGTSVQLTSTCKDQNGVTMICPTMIWSSSDASKATVDSTGKVTGVAAGTTNVTAKSGTISSNVSTITVIQSVEKKFSVNDVTPGSVINNVGVLAVIDPAGSLTKDQACVEVCRLLGLI